VRDNDGHYDDDDDDDDEHDLPIARVYLNFNHNQLNIFQLLLFHAQTELNQ